MSKSLLVGIAGTIFSASIAAAEGPDVTRGAILASTCFTCHGTDGKSPGEMPSIYGVPTESMVKTLQDFKSGMRQATVMGRHAKGYSDDQIREIAEYLSTIK